MKTVIFDFDYTLGDSSQGIVLSVSYALSRLGYGACSGERIKRTIGLSMKDTLRELTGDEDPEKVLLFSRYFREKADQVMLDNTVLYDGVVDALAGLKERGFKTAVVTTKYHYRIDQILKKFGAEELIDGIVGAEDVKIEKPDPEGLLRVIRDFGAQKEDVIYVGDSLVDAKTAENGGVSFIAVLTGKTEEAEFRERGCLNICGDVPQACRLIAGTGI